MRPIYINLLLIYPKLWYFKLSQICYIRPNTITFFFGNHLCGQKKTYVIVPFHVIFKKYITRNFFKYMIELLIGILITKDKND